MPALLQKGLRDAYDFMGNTYDNVGKQFYHVRPTSAGYDMVQHFNPYQVLPQQRDFGGDIAEASITQGFSKTYIQSMFGLKDVIPNEIINRDQYGMLTRWCTARGSALAEIYDTNDEILAVNVFRTGFTTTTPSIGSPDGQPLFSLSHPLNPTNSTPQANMPPIAMPFGMAALQFARANLETQNKANGLTKWKNKPKLVQHHPNIEEIVLQCLHSDWVPGTADRDMNTMNNRGIRNVSNPYWTISGSSNPTAYNSWMVQGEVHYFNWFILTPVEFDSQKILGINSTMFASFQEQTMGWDAYWGTVGSVGS